MLHHARVIVSDFQIGYAGARRSLFSFRAVLKLINTPAQRTFIEKERYVTSLRTAAKETRCSTNYSLKLHFS